MEILKPLAELIGSELKRLELRCGATITNDVICIYQEARSSVTGEISHNIIAKLLQEGDMIWAYDWRPFGPPDMRLPLADPECFPKLVYWITLIVVKSRR